MRNPARTIALGLFALTLHAPAQHNVRITSPLLTLTDDEKNSLDQQAYHLFNAAKPAVAKASLSTVTISALGEQLSLGTAITKDGQILTKWSEVAHAKNRLVVTTPDGKIHRGVVTDIYKEYDLAIVKSNAQLTPVHWSKKTTPELGEFIALANPSGEVEGLGVVSVQARSLRQKDQAYLGVLMNFSAAGKNGIPLQEVIPQSSAFHAGLQKGDVITSIDGNPVQGAIEMKSALVKLVPGSKIVIKYYRGNKKYKTKAIMGSRADNKNTLRVPQRRMAQMQRMGASPNQVRDNFPYVIQSDMPIDPNDTGAPVVNLDGKVIGLSIARGSRIKTFIIPSQTIIDLLNTRPSSYTPNFTTLAPH